MKSTSDRFIQKLKEKTPEGINTVDVLTDIIPMSKEAAYRRLRGEIEFTFAEAIKIMQKLGISFDSLMEEDAHGKQHYKVEVSCINSGSFMEDYALWAENTLNAMQTLRMCPQHQALSVNNNISVLYLFNYETLARFRLHKWMYQRNSTHKHTKMCDLDITARVISLEKMMMQELRQTKITFLYSHDLMQSLVGDISYFKRLNLVSQEEVRKMKAEAFALLGDMERDAILGKNYDMPCSIHVTNVRFDGDLVLWKNNTIAKVTLRIFGVNHYSISDQKAIADMSNWTNMLLRSSTQISFSGEKKRIDFFQRQREILETL